MPARRLTVEVGASRLAVRTRAVGMLARLAHDLEIVATRFDAPAELDGDAWTAELTVPVDALEVAGVLKHDRVDTSVLSASDRAEIVKRMRDDAFRGASTVQVRASGADRDRAQVVVVVGGREAKSTVALRTRDDGDAIVVSGEVPLSLKSIGAREIKAPLGAFSVKDEVLVVFELRLR
jgi:hypothetical protein